MPDTYDDAVLGALDRLQGVGFEFGPGFAAHGPMAAEALATLGFTGTVAGWVEEHKRSRRFHEPPGRTAELSAADESQWRPALGEFSRVADWTALFERELAERPWTDVLALWWPRLLPGLSAALTHGVIRTAHAVRGLATTAEVAPLQLSELAHGLGYWAAKYAAPPRHWGLVGGRRADRRLAPGPAGGDDVQAALSDLTAGCAGVYAAAELRIPIPLVHAVTAPAAVRLVLPHLPADQHRPSYEMAHQVSRGLVSVFGGRWNARPAPAPVDTPPAELVAAAVEIGDEHVIKLTEAALREDAVRPDPRYAAAAAAIIRAMGRPVS